MEKYINKSALLAEIQRRIKEYQSTGDDYWFPVIENLKSILSFLNTHEVKEVGFQIYVGEELENFLSKHKVYDDLDIAKHFFELGMQVSDKAQKGEEV